MEGPNGYQNIATGLAKSERSAEPLPYFSSKFCVLPYELGIFKLSRLAKYILRNLVHRGIQKLREKTALGKQKIMAKFGLRILKNHFICLISLHVLTYLLTILFWPTEGDNKTQLPIFNGHDS